MSPVSGGEIAAIITALAVGIPAVSVAVGSVRKAMREARDARDKQIEERIRAEFYKREAEVTITQKNAEIETWKLKHGETDGRLQHLLDNEWPRMRSQIDSLIASDALKSETTANLSRRAFDP